MTKEFGDFQTPPELAAQVLATLQREGWAWSRVLEPTCGRGNFITALHALPQPPAEVRGFELQPAHVAAAQTVAAKSIDTQVEVEQADFFQLDLRSLSWHERGPLLVVGNPPWITNASLGVLDSANLPSRSNPKALRGLDALTGKANYDLAEAVWLKLLTELADQQPTIALLCKTSVARSVIEYAARAGLPVSSAALYRLDARRWFAAEVDACLFRVTLTEGAACYEAAVYADLTDTQPSSTIGVVGGRLVADLSRYAGVRQLDGRSTLIWRQGIKHDAVKVAELRPLADGLYNHLGEPADIEADYRYPLLKSADLSRTLPTPRYQMIVPQRQFGEDTSRLATVAPKLWRYLNDHAMFFNQRKSSIYRRQPAFAYFGIGPYSFAPYKVAVAGLCKQPRFHALGPLEGRPLVLDDTCYFVACRSAAQAALLSALLGSPACTSLLHSIVEWSAKRPITISVLERINLQAVWQASDQHVVLAQAAAEHQRLTGSAGPVDWAATFDDLLKEQPTAGRRQTGNPTMQQPALFLACRGVSRWMSSNARRGNTGWKWRSCPMPTTKMSGQSVGTTILRNI